MNVKHTKTIARAALEEHSRLYISGCVMVLQDVTKVATSETLSGIELRAAHHQRMDHLGCSSMMRGTSSNYFGRYLGTWYKLQLVPCNCRKCNPDFTCLPSYLPCHITQQLITQLDRERIHLQVHMDLLSVR